MEVVDNKCPNCDANLDFDPQNNNWTCEYCRTVYETSDINRISSNVLSNIYQLECPNCGAILFEEENVISATCPYCRNNVIITKQDEYICPDKLIPFSINREKAIEKLLEKLDNMPLVAKNFDLQKNIEEVKGIYVPFWLYSNQYKVSIYSKDQMHNPKKFKLYFKHVPYDANKHLDNDLTKALEPYDYSALINFDKSYLAGFLAQRYDVLSNEGTAEINNRCLNSINYTFRDIRSKDFIMDIAMIGKTLNRTKIQYALLPLWLLTINYKNKKYVLAINGQTGKLVGNIPMSRSKFFLVKLLVFCVCILCCIALGVLLRIVGVL